MTEADLYNLNLKYIQISLTKQGHMFYHYVILSLETGSFTVVNTKLEDLLSKMLHIFIQVHSQ